MAKIKFKDWYLERHQQFPGYPGERIDHSMMRLAEAMAEWADMVANGTVPEAKETQPSNADEALALARKIRENTTIL